MLHLHPRVPTHLPDSGEQTPNQHIDTDRHETRAKAEGVRAAALQSTNSSVLPDPCRNPMPCSGRQALVGGAGEAAYIWGFLHQGQEEDFKKGGTVLNAVIDLQACLGFSAARRCPHFKESFRPAAIRGSVMQ